MTESSWTNARNPDPNERLTLPEQLRLLAKVMPEERARARIEKAFRFREIDYQPQYAFPYVGAQIDWQTGRVTLSPLRHRPFTPTLTGAEFLGHFLPSRPTGDRASPLDDEDQSSATASTSSSPTPHRFEHPLWAFGDVLGWLMDRHPNNFGRFWTQDDFRSEYYRRAMLKSGSPPLVKNPRQVLLHALQRGQLTAYRQGRRLDRTEWFAKTETDILHGLRDFIVERDQVLNLWPAVNRPPTVSEQAAGDDQQSSPAATPPGFRTNRAEDAERECERFIDDSAAAFNAGQKERPKNKDAAFEAARNHCGDALSRKAFERAWGRRAPAAWKAPGARWT
jgi:hypothetical protein